MSETETIPEDVMEAASKVVVDLGIGGGDERSVDGFTVRDAIARAILAERAASEARMAELLQDPVAVRANWLRGGINATSIIAEERERCAKIAEGFTLQHILKTEPTSMQHRPQSVFVPGAHLDVAAAIRNPSIIKGKAGE